jgi:regulator of replication initiation timing
MSLGDTRLLPRRVEQVAAKNAELRAENAELKRRLGMNSTNSGTPTSKESIQAAAERKARRQSSQRVHRDR